MNYSNEFKKIFLSLITILLLFISLILNFNSKFELQSFSGSNNLALYSLQKNINSIDLNLKQDDTDVKALLNTVEPDTDKSLDFYSSSLDLLIKYPSNLGLIFTEGNKFVTFGFYRNNFDYGFIKILDSFQNETDIQNFYKKNFSYTYQQVEVSDIKPLSSDSNIKAFNITYYKNILGQAFTEKRLILLRKLEDKKFLVIEFVHLQDIEKYLQFLTYLINNAVFKPENIQNNITLSFESSKKYKINLTLDQKKWLKISQTNKFSNFEFNPKYEENKSFVSSLKIRDNVFPPNFVDPDFNLYKEAERKIQDLEANYDNLKIESQLTTKKIADLDAVDFFVSYTDKITQKLTNLYYVSIKYDDYNFINIQFTYSSKNSNAFSEFNKFLNSIVKQAEDSSSNDSSDLVKNILGESVIKIDFASILGKPSTVKIYNKTCLDLTFGQIVLLPTMSNKKYTYCTAGTGSGFFVSKDGYLVTNAHVATPNVEDALLNFLNIGANAKFLSDFYKDIKYALGQDFNKLTDVEILQVASYIIFKLVDENSIKITPKYENYILKYDKDFKISQKDLNLINLSDVFSTQLIDYNKIPSLQRVIFSSQPKSGIKNDSRLGTPDLAVLKVNENNQNYPVIKLADPNSVIPGMDVIVIGYPAIVERTALFSNNSVSTLTKGTVSAIKKDSTNKYKLIQIDASISPGNSGGPILNSTGELIGVSTYGITGGSADFNAGVFVDSVIEFMKKNNIKNELSDTTDKVLDGLYLFSERKYKLAVDNFDYAVKAWIPFSEVLFPLINISNKAIQEGKDKSEEVQTLNTSTNDEQNNNFSFEGLFGGNNIFILIICAIVLFVVLLVLIIVYTISKPKKSNLKYSLQDLKQLNNLNNNNLATNQTLNSSSIFTNVNNSNNNGANTMNIPRPTR